MEEKLNLHGVTPSLRNKRIGALDFGRKRIGFAVCDEFHITVSPRGVFQYSNTEEFWEKLLAALAKERLGAVVVGMPYRLDGEETKIIREIGAFITNLRARVSIPVIPYDESYSSVRALSTMIEAGTKKKKRREKGSADRVAAALILRDFLEELDRGGADVTG